MHKTVSTCIHLSHSYSQFLYQICLSITSVNHVMKICTRMYQHAWIYNSICVCMHQHMYMHLDQIHTCIIYINILNASLNQIRSSLSLFVTTLICIRMWRAYVLIHYNDLYFCFRKVCREILKELICGIQKQRNWCAVPGTYVQQKSFKIVNRNGFCNKSQFLLIWKTLSFAMLYTWSGTIVCGD